MFKPPGASVPSWKMSRRSSRCRVAVPPFTCLTTDTRMSWTWLCSGRLKCSATGNPPPPGSGGSVWNPPLNAGVPRNDPKDLVSVQVLGLCVLSNRRCSAKCFAKIYRAQYGNAMLVHIRCAPTWRPRNSVNIWNLRWLSRRLTICI